MGLELAFQVSYYLTDKEDGRGDEDNDKPVVPMEGNNIEHLTAKLHDEDLPKEDEGDDEQELAAATEIEGTASCKKSAGVEEVPELEHDKGCEEEALLIGRENNSPIRRQ